MIFFTNSFIQTGVVQFISFFVLNLKLFLSLSNF